MLNFVINAFFWTMALYGIWEITKNIIYFFTYTNLKTKGIYVILAVKNQENDIEFFLRTFLFRLLYGKEENVREVIVADLQSEDGTREILSRFQKENDCIKVTNWKECKQIIDSINK